MIFREQLDGTSLISAKEAAFRLNMSTKTLRGHVKDGALPCVFIGRGGKRKHFAFDPADIEAFIRARKRTETGAQIQTKRSGATSAKTSSYVDLREVRARLIAE